MGFFDQSPDEITDGPIGRVLLLLAGPLFVQNMAHVAQQTIDLFWLGRHSSATVAAVGLDTPLVLFLLQSTIAATFVGTHVLVSQRVGADDEEGAQRALFTGLLLTTILGLGIGGMMFFYADLLIGAIGAVRPGSVGGTVLEYAVAYLEVIALGVVFAGLSDVVEASFLGWGDSRTTFYINLATVIANVVLTPVFMFGAGPAPSLGIRGAAIGTVGGYVSGFLLGVWFLRRGPRDQLSRSAVGVDLDEIRELLDIGLPRAVQGIANRTGGLLIVVIIFSIGGSAGVAAYTVGSRIGTFAFRTTNALGQAVQTVVGQSLGAGDPERAVRTVWTGSVISAGVLLAFAGVQFLLPGAITNAFTPQLDGRGFALSVVYLQILAFAYPASGVLSLLRAGFNGARRTKTTMVASLVQRWLFYIPLAAVAVFLLDHDVVAVFWSNTISVFATLACVAGYFVYSTNRGMFRRASEATG